MLVGWMKYGSSGRLKGFPAFLILSVVFICSVPVLSWRIIVHKQWLVRHTWGHILMGSLDIKQKASQIFGRFPASFVPTSTALALGLAQLEIYRRAPQQADF